MLKKWEDLPSYMRTDAVRPYYDRLRKKRSSLFLKRIFDLVAAFVLLILLTPLMIGIAAIIMVDSKGGPFFFQERVTQYGRKFRIIKFRTMGVRANREDPQVTAFDDTRITKVGKVLRKYRLDELPQLINIILGDMSFCGIRPEVPKFVRRYSREMMATLLIPAGVTSEASIWYKDEERLLKGAQDVDEVYVREVLPKKMECNLGGLRKFGFFRDIGIMFRTVGAVFFEQK